MTKCNVILITGFLGSGKTTLLKNLLEIYSGGRRVAVIQNEYAGAGVDADELKNSGREFYLLEINNGSIFCICQFANFIEQAGELYEKYHPEIMFIEASGMADPIAAGSVFNNHPYFFLSGIVCVVDCANYEVMKRLVLPVNNQVRIADLVILNKQELVDEKRYNSIIESVIEINPIAEIASTSFCNLPDFNFADMDPISCRIAGEPVKPGTSFYSEIIKNHKIMSCTEIENFIKDIPSSVYRMKGFIRTGAQECCLLQYVNGATSLRYLNFGVSKTEIIKISII